MVVRQWRNSTDLYKARNMVILKMEGYVELYNPILPNDFEFHCFLMLQTGDSLIAGMPRVDGVYWMQLLCLFLNP